MSCLSVHPLSPSCAHFETCLGVIKTICKERRQKQPSGYVDVFQRERRDYMLFVTLPCLSRHEDNVSLCIQDPLAHMADMLAIDNLSSGQPFLAKVCIGYYKIVLL